MERLLDKICFKHGDYGTYSEYFQTGKWICIITDKYVYGAAHAIAFQGIFLDRTVYPFDIDKWN